MLIIEKIFNDIFRHFLGLFVHSKTSPVVEVLLLNCKIECRMDSVKVDIIRKMVYNMRASCGFKEKDLGGKNIKRSNSTR